MYFKILEGIEFSSATKNQLEKYILKNKDYFKYTGTKPDEYGNTDWNWYCPNDLLPTNLIDEVGKRFNIPVKYEILGQTPWTKGKIHKDWVSKEVPRVCCISLPITPNYDDFSCTQFWRKDRFENYILADEVDYSIPVKAVVFNLQEWHCAINPTHHYRFHCQFATDLPFEQVCELYENNELFD